MNAFAIALGWTLAIVGPLAGQTPAPSQCIFSGPDKAALAWQSAAAGASGGTLEGHIVRVRNLQPIQSAYVTLAPGDYHAMSDSAGAFHFVGVPNGRYLLRVRALGYPAIGDSITLGADGLIFLAALPEARGDIAITCLSAPVRPPSTQR